MIKTVTLSVSGMSCGGCESAVCQAINELHGITDVTASHQLGQVVAEYDETTLDVAQIIGAIEDAGFDVLS